MLTMKALFRINYVQNLTLFHNFIENELVLFDKSFYPFFRHEFFTLRIKQLVMSTQYLATANSTSDSISLHNFLKDNYKESKQVTGFVTFRHELTGKYDSYEMMKLPVNNFLKDFTDIDNEFHFEVNRTSEPGSAPYGNVIPIEQALRGPMEENY